MVHLRGRYRARRAQSNDDVIACQQLRYLAFMQQRGIDGAPDALDTDEFDSICEHIMVEDQRSGQLVCCFRMLPMDNGSQIGKSYSAKYYDLRQLQDFPGKLVEMGRFCIHPAYADPTILRVAWTAMTRFVDEEGIELLCGCSSFEGVEADNYADAFALLKEKHIAPSRWMPRIKAPNVFRFANIFKLRRPDMKQALGKMPPLLRTYLVMGGWVSDHAVIDNDLKTLHVFTGVEIARVPKTRAKLLRRG